MASCGPSRCSRFVVFVAVTLSGDEGSLLIREMKTSLLSCATDCLHPRPHNDQGREISPCRYSEWCDGGEEFYKARRHDHPAVRLTPGIHYRVKDFTGHEHVIAYPDRGKALETFRHRWVMVRHNRPVVPAFTRSRLPPRRRLPTTYELPMATATARRC